MSESDMLFPLENVVLHVSKVRKEVHRDGHRAFWHEYGGVTELRVERVDQPTSDGLMVQEIVTLEHSSPHLNSPLPMAMLNAYATMSALVPGPQKGSPPRLVCRVGIFSGDGEAAERLYAPLIALEACIIGWRAASIAYRVFSRDPEESPLMLVNDLPCFTRKHFEDALERARATNGFSFGGEPGLTVEWPWEDGAVSKSFANPELRAKVLSRGDLTEADLDRMAGDTVLFQIQTDQRHPLFGNGALARLALPISLDRDAALSLADELNQWELATPDLPPLFGSWCVDVTTDFTVVFVSFLPNHACAEVPGLLENLTAWSCVRQGMLLEKLRTDS